MSEEFKREPDWEELSSKSSMSEPPEFTSDDVHLGRLVQEMYLWKKSAVKKLEIMSGTLCHLKNIKLNFFFQKYVKFSRNRLLLMT